MLKYAALEAILAGCFFTVTNIAHAHITAVDPGFTVTSDFGPRLLPSPDFHKGIDYGTAEGVSLPLLEAGRITSLNYANDGILILSLLTDNNHFFRYLHMFNNASLPIDSGEFTLTRTDEENLCIVRWLQGTNRTVADYALSAENADNQLVLINGTPVLNAQGENLRTTSRARSPVGPAGTSGGFPAHMHIDLGLGVSENPLTHINHTASNFTVQFIDQLGRVRTNGFLVNVHNSASTFLKVRLDSQIGTNLDSLDIFVDNISITGHVRTWAYGGLTSFHDPLHTDIETSGCPDDLPGCRDRDPPVYADGSSNGVLPRGVGREDFVFTDWMPEGLHDGEHRLIACWTNIRNQTNCQETRFEIDGTPPTLDLIVADTEISLPEGQFTNTSKLLAQAEDPKSGLESIKLFGPDGSEISQSRFLGGETTPQSTEFSLSGLPDGTYRVEAKDKSGNIKNFSFILDISGPKLAATFDDPSLAVEATDEGSGIASVKLQDSSENVINEISFSGENLVNAPFNIGSLPDGSYSIVAIDRAGNSSTQDGSDSSPSEFQINLANFKIWSRGVSRLVHRGLLSPEQAQLRWRIEEFPIEAPHIPGTESEVVEGGVVVKTISEVAELNFSGMLGLLGETIVPLELKINWNRRILSGSPHRVVVPAGIFSRTISPHICNPSTSPCFNDLTVAGTVFSQTREFCLGSDSNNLICHPAFQSNQNESLEPKISPVFPQANIPEFPDPFLVPCADRIETINIVPQGNSIPLDGSPTLSYRFIDHNQFSTPRSLGLCWLETDTGEPAYVYSSAGVFPVAFDPTRPQGILRAMVLENEIPGTQVLRRGNNISVQLGINNAELAFDQVSHPGHIYAFLESEDVLPPEEAVQTVVPQFGVISLANTQGNVALRIPYDDAGLNPEDEANVRLYQIGSLIDITTQLDTSLNVVIGTTSSLGTFIVAIKRGEDRVPPRTVLRVGTPQIIAEPLIIGPDTPLELTSNDGLLSPGDGLGVGVASLTVTIDGLFTHIFSNKDPPDKPFITTVTLLGAGDGPHTIGYSATDFSGNQEEQQTAILALDQTPPQTTLKASRELFKENNVYYATSNDSFSFETQDNLAGVKHTLYSVNGGEFQVFNPQEPLIFPSEGEFILVFKSVDHVDNAEAGHAATIIIDNTPPSFSDTLYVRAADPLNTLTDLEIAHASVRLAGQGEVDPSLLSPWSVEYTGDVLPEENTPRFRISPLFAPAFERSVEEGLLKISAFQGEALIYEQPNLRISSDKGYVLEMRARPVDEDSALRMGGFNNRYGILLTISGAGQGRLTVGDNPEELAFGSGWFQQEFDINEPMEFHDYRIAVKDFLVKVLADETTIVEQDVREFLPPHIPAHELPFMPFAEFGAGDPFGAGANSSNVEIDYFRYFTDGPQLPQQTPVKPMISYEAGVIPQDFSPIVRTMPLRQDTIGGIVSQQVIDQRFLRAAARTQGGFFYSLNPNINSSQQYTLELKARPIGDLESVMTLNFFDGQFQGRLFLDKTGHLALVSGGQILYAAQGIDVGNFHTWGVSVQGGDLKLSIDGQILFTGFLPPFEGSLADTLTGFGARNAIAADIKNVGLEVESFVIRKDPEGLLVYEGNVLPQHNNPPLQTVLSNAQPVIEEIMAGALRVGVEGALGFVSYLFVNTGFNSDEPYGIEMRGRVVDRAALLMQFNDERNSFQLRVDHDGNVSIQRTQDVQVEMQMMNIRERGFDPQEFNSYGLNNGGATGEEMTFFINNEPIGFAFRTNPPLPPDPAALTFAGFGVESLAPIGQGIAEIDFFRAARGATGQETVFSYDAARLPNEVGLARIKEGANLPTLEETEEKIREDILQVQTDLGGIAYQFPLALNSNESYQLQLRGRPASPNSLLALGFEDESFAGILLIDQAGGARIQADMLGAPIASAPMPDALSFHAYAIEVNSGKAKVFADNQTLFEAQLPPKSASLHPGGFFGVAAVEPFVAQGLPQMEIDYFRIAKTVQEGALAGTLETPFINVSTSALFSGFTPIQFVNEGQIIHEFTNDGTNFFPVSELSQTAISAGQIKFKSTLSRDDKGKKSPVLTALRLEFDSKVQLSASAISKRQPLNIEFLASERLVGKPSVTIGDLNAVDGNVPASLSWNFNFLIDNGIQEGLIPVVIKGRDLSGNEGQDETALVLVDVTPPRITVKSPVSNIKLIHPRDKAKIDVLVQDNFDPAPISSATLIQTQDKGETTGPAFAPVANGQELDLLSLDDGIWTLSAQAQDSVFNSTSVVSGPFEIVHKDILPPRTTLFIGLPRLGQEPVFITANTTLNFDVKDDANELGDSQGIGVERLNLGLDSIFDEAVLNPQSTSPVFSKALNLLGVEDRTYDLRFYAQDTEGNSESTQTIKIALDNTPPATELILPSGVFRENGTIYVNSADMIDFRSTDAGSGVRETVFRLERLNGNAQEPCPEPDPVTDECPADQGNSEPVMLPMNFSEEGRFVLTFDATDNLDNHSSAQSVVIVVDNTPPTFSGTAPLFIQANDPVNVFNGLTAFNGGVKLIDGGGPGPGPDPGTGQWTVEYQAAGTAELPTGFAPPFQFLASIPILNVSQELTPGSLRLTTFGFAHAFYTQENFELNIDQGYVTEMRGRAMNEQTALSMTVISDQDTALELLIEPGQGTLRFTNGDLLSPETATIGEFPIGAGTGETRTYLLSVGPDPNSLAEQLVRVFEDGVLRLEAALPTSPFAFDALPQVAYGAKTLVPDGTLDAEFEFFRYFTGGPEPPTGGSPGNGGGPGGVLVDYQATVLPEQFGPFVQKRINRFFTQPPSEQIVTEGATMQSFLKLSSPDDGDINYLFMQELSASQEYRLELRAALKTSDSRLLIFMQDDQFGGVLEIDTAAGLARLFNNSREQVLGRRDIDLPPAQTFDFLDYLVTVSQGNVRLSVNGNEILTGQLTFGDPDLRGAGFGLEARSFEPVPIGLDVRSFRILSGPSGNGGGGSQEGTLLGTVETPFISLPELSKINHFQVTQNLAQGSIQHEFTSDGQNFFPIDLLSSADITHRQIKFRSTLSRATTEQASPVLEFLSLDLIRIVDVSSPSVAGPLSTATIRFIASERLLGEPVVKAGNSQAFDKNEPPSFSWTFKLSAAQDALEGEQTIVISGKDLSRNQGEDQTEKILIDRTPPVVTVSSPAGGERFVASQGSITINASVSDNFDPAPDILRLELVQRQNTGTTRGPTRLIVHQGQVIDPLSIDDGLWVLEVEAKDWVNNSTITVSGVFEVIHDLLAPRTSLVAGEPKFGDNPVFVTKDTSLGFSAIDDLVEVGDGIGLGVARTEFSVDQSSFAVFSATFAISAEGFHEVKFFSVDVVGNQETIKTVQIAVDNTPPTTELSLGEGAFSAFGRTVITPNTLITLSAVDPKVNGVSSDVSQTEFAVDDDAFQVYSAAFTLPAQGEHAVKYRSRDNLGNLETARTLALSVTPLRETAMIAAGTATITASGTADIVGKIVSNGAYNASGNVRLTGSVMAPAIELKGNSVIIGTQTIASDSVHASPIDLASIKADLAQTNDNGLIPSQFLSPDGALVVSKGAILTLDAGSYLFSGMSIDSQAALISSGPVRIFLTGPLVITGAGSMNASGRAADLVVFSDFDRTHEFAGGSRAAVILYAPNSSVKATGNSSITGNLFAKDIVIQGASLFVQADGLSGQIPAQTQDGEKQKGGAKTAAALDTPQALGPDPKFQLGEIYAYPNPAIGGAKPTLHIETGLADSARILIYSISGELVKEESLSGLPQIIDDGQGPQYAYEWDWDGHIPSGTYFYLVEAKKGSEVLRAKGKIYVVR